MDCIVVSVTAFFMNCHVVVFRHKVNLISFVNLNYLQTYGRQTPWLILFFAFFPFKNSFLLRYFDEIWHVNMKSWAAYLSTSPAPRWAVKKQNKPDERRTFFFDLLWVCRACAAKFRLKSKQTVILILLHTIGIQLICLRRRTWFSHKNKTLPGL